MEVDDFAILEPRIDLDEYINPIAPFIRINSQPTHEDIANNPLADDKENF